MNSNTHRPASKKMLAIALFVVAIMIASAVAVLVLLTLRFSEDEPEPFGTFKIGLPERVDSLNPYIGLSHSSMIFYGLVYDCLQSVGNDMESEPNLAIDWQIVDEIQPYGSVWEYNLTENAVWHDGVPFDANDVVFTLNLLAGNYSTILAYHPYTYFIHHAELVDDRTVRVHFFDRGSGESIPFSFGDSLFIPILPRHLFLDHDATFLGFSWSGAQESSDPPLVGTGPFMVTSAVLDEWMEGDRITLVRNPDYHWAIDQEREVDVDEVRLYFYDDDTAMALALEHGNLDVASLSPESLLHLRNKTDSGETWNVQTYSGPTCTNQLLTITFGNYRNASSPLIDDVVIRRALSMVIDRSEVIEDAYLGLADEGSTLISPLDQDMHYEVTEAEVIGYDPVAAAQLLEEHGYRFTNESPYVRVATNDSASVQNGWVPENTPLELTICAMQRDIHLRAIAEMASSAWGELGVKVYIVYVTNTYWPTYPITPVDYDILLTERTLSHPDPAYILFSDSICAGDDWLSYGYSNETYDQYYFESVTSVVEAERVQSVKDCQRVYYLDVGAIVLAYPNQTYAWRTDTISGWGDWSANPGRSIDAFWGGNPLYFDISCVQYYEMAASFSLDEPIISRTRP